MSVSTNSPGSCRRVVQPVSPSSGSRSSRLRSDSLAVSTGGSRCQPSASASSSVGSPFFFFLPVILPDDAFLELVGDPAVDLDFEHRAAVEFEQRLVAQIQRVLLAVFPGKQLLATALSERAVAGEPVLDGIDSIQFDKRGWCRLEPRLGRYLEDSRLVVARRGCHLGAAGNLDVSVDISCRFDRQRQPGSLRRLWSFAQRVEKPCAMLFGEAVEPLDHLATELRADRQQLVGHIVGLWVPVVDVLVGQVGQRVVQLAGCSIVDRWWSAQLSVSAHPSPSVM